MDKRTPGVEWIITESDADWDPLRVPNVPEGDLAANCRRPLQRYYWSVAVLFFLLLVGVGGWEWHTTQAATHQVEAAATVMAQPEVGEVAPSPDSLVASI